MVSSRSKITRSVCFVASACAILIIAISVASAQYKSDSEDRVLSQAELARLMRSSKLARNSATDDGYAPTSSRGFGAARNLYNRQQPLQYAPSFNKRSNYGGEGADGGFAGHGGLGGADSLIGRSSANNNNDDDDDDSADGPSSTGFGANFDSNDDGNNADSDSRLNQAASGYPGTHSDYSGDVAAGGFGPSGFDGADFGPSEGFGGSSHGNGRLRQAGSSSAGLRNQFGAASDDDAGIPAYNPGPNSAVNADGDTDDDATRGAAPENNQNDGEDDD